jgi:tetratricopeptide (TPR) repeat protein
MDRLCERSYRARMASGRPAIRRRWTSLLVTVAMVRAFALPVMAQTPADKAGEIKAGEINARAGAARAAVIALRSQRFVEALRVVDEALGPLVAAKGEDDREVLTLLILKGQACYGLGRPQEAIDALAPFARSLEAPAPLVGPGSDWNALTVLGDSFMALDRWSDALVTLDRARSMLADDGRIDPRSKAINTATTLGKIGTARACLEDWPGARQAFEQQVAALGGEAEGGGAYLAAAHNGLGIVADNVGDLAAAAEHYSQAAKIYEEQFGLEHPYTKRALTTLARVRGKLGDTQEADRITARLASVDTMPTTIPPTLQPVPSTIPDHPAAPPMPLFTRPVMFAVTAAMILAALTASGFLGRRSRRADRDPGTSEAEDGAVGQSATEND